ncbi:hypothetical protein CBS101457_004774 [Exobasidium rhododendri]|nr:hypothetical protein CBS101457_004774 [Exobasidium rhododendri]
MLLIVFPSVQPAQTSKSSAWSASNAVNPLLNPRLYLTQGLLEESDSDSDSEAQDEELQASEERGAGSTNGTEISTGIDPENEKQERGQDVDADNDEEEIRQMHLAARRKGESEGTIRENKKEAGEVQTEAKPTALQSERSIQDSLSGELLRMAGILKTNSMAFADALERDRKLLEEAGEKLQGNLTLMTRTRGKLGEYSQKARGMGWLTLGTVAVVCMSWVIMFILIRLT